MNVLLGSIILSLMNNFIIRIIVVTSFRDEPIICSIVYTYYSSLTSHNVNPLFFISLSTILCYITDNNAICYTGEQGVTRIMFL